MSKVTLAVTMGDPAGIGPEVVLKGLERPQEFPGIAFVVVGVQSVLAETAQSLRLPFEWPFISRKEVSSLTSGTVAILEPPDIPTGPFALGILSPDAGRAGVMAVEYAVDMALESLADAIVTAPLNKEAIGLAGYDYPGHTELLQERTGSKKVVMMLCSDRLRVALVTIHRALRSAIEGLSEEAIFDCIRVTDEYLRRYFRLDKPRLAVAGLNPHAGEGGRFGDEESRIIQPAVDRAMGAGVECRGPLAPDTVFVRAAAGEFDAVVCMYHDQGLIPLKLLSFASAVNVTLGLPIVRTSVDHGTGFDIAGKGVASAASLENAVKLAATIVRNLRQQ